ncbi:MAG: hypothetical protein ABIP51_07760 [Bacteroidia bacterium]
MKAILLTLFALLLTYILPSQTDSVQVPLDLNITDGVFLTYADFRFNKGISKEQIISTNNKDQLDFIGKTLEKETFIFQDSQKTTTISSNSVWGYFQNKTLYINYKGVFYRVPVFGSVCYLVATVEIVGVGFYDPMYGAGVNNGGRRQEIREFLINFYDGIITEFRMDEAEFLLGRDKELFVEYKKLSRRKQKEQIFRYIRKYNDKHPVYFLK